MGTEAEFELEEIKEIIDDFLVEADELVASLDTNLVTLENQPEDLEQVYCNFRDFPGCPYHKRDIQLSGV